LSEGMMKKENKNSIEIVQESDKGSA